MCADYGRRRAGVIWEWLYHMIHIQEHNSWNRDNDEMVIKQPLLVNLEIFRELGRKVQLKDAASNFVNSFSLDDGVTSWSP